MTSHRTSGRLRAAVVRSLTRAATTGRLARVTSRKLLHAKRLTSYRAACKRTVVDQRTVVFECYGGRAYTCSPRAIYQAMLADRRFDGFEYLWVLRAEDTELLASAGQTNADRARDEHDAVFRFGTEAIEELSHATIIEFGSAAYQRAYARAGTWVSNYILPSHLSPRKGQRYLQTWHGTPLKCLGCDIPADKRSAMFSVAEIHARYRAEGTRLTWLLCPSRFACDKFADAFGLSATSCSSKLLEAGYPRNDALAVQMPRARLKAIKHRLRIPEGHRVLLYAPTFRDDEHTAGIGYALSHLPDFELLRERLGNGYTVLFRPHYLIAREFDFGQHEGFVVDVSAVSDINDLYLVSDMLVTDYSSVFFDYANLERPIVFYMHDLERYRTELRGLYLGLEELPGPIVHTSGQLVEELRRLERPDATRIEQLQRFRTRFAPHDDGKAARRVLERVFGTNDSGADGQH